MKSEHDLGHCKFCKSYDVWVSRLRRNFRTLLEEKCERCRKVQMYEITKGINTVTCTKMESC